MAIVAATHGIDEVATQAYQRPVLLNEVEFDRCDCKSTLDPRFALVVVRLSARRADEHSSDNGHNDQSMHLASHNIPPFCHERIDSLPNRKVPDCRHNK